MILAPFLFDILLPKDDSGHKINVLKRDNRYINLTFELSGTDVQFVDILNFLSPCSLNQFYKMTGVDCGKSIWPYQYYHSVSDLKTRNFPPLSAFVSDLKYGEMTCTEETYEDAKDLFLSRLNLPSDHPDRWNNMFDFLKHYNNADVLGLIPAIRSWFNKFRKSFNVDPFMFASLASMSFAAMMQQFASDSPFATTLPSWKSDLNLKFRKSIVGGLTTTLHRAIVLDGSEAPSAAKISPSGDPYTAVLPYDFNRFL